MIVMIISDEQLRLGLNFFKAWIFNYLLSYHVNEAYDDGRLDLMIFNLFLIILKEDFKFLCYLNLQFALVVIHFSHSKKN